MKKRGPVLTVQEPRPTKDQRDTLESLTKRLFQTREMSLPEQLLSEHLADNWLQTLDECRTLYERTSNPSWVWEGIATACMVAKVRCEPVSFPDWIVAYLCVSASQIAGWATADRLGDRNDGIPITYNDDGSTTLHVTKRSLSASQRHDALLEALRFKGKKGENPLAQAYRDKVRLKGASREERSGDGASDLPEANSMIADPSRKRRRDRRRVKTLTKR
jgi:hypothetical protein